MVVSIDIEIGPVGDWVTFVLFATVRLKYHFHYTSAAAPDVDLMVNVLMYRLSQ
jgi:hypothetical protein